MTPDELRDLLSPVAPLKLLGETATLSDIEQALREFAAALEGRDALARVIAEEGALRELERLKVRRPAALLEAALGGKASQSNLAGREVAVEDPEPWPEPVDGAALLDELVTTIRRYVVLQSEYHAAAISLWVAHTWAVDVFQVTPRLAITSPTRRCGKSTLLTLAGALVRRPLPSSNITSAALFRAVEAFSPTVLIDEADTFLGDRDELRGLLNAGHHRAAAWVIRTVGDDHEVRRFFVFAPVAIAAIGSLPDTLADRSIRVEMRRREPGEKIEPLRLDRLADFDPLRRKLARWAADNLEALRQADPVVPESLNDRAADNWRPLLAIADATGGDWPRLAREAARVLEGAEAGEDADVRVQLLADIKAVFDERRADWLETQAILDALRTMEDRPWAEWSRGEPITATALARLLKPFGIKPGKRGEGPRHDRTTARGYRRADFEPVWRRYLPGPNGAANPTHLTHSDDDGLSGDSQTRHTEACVSGCENGQKPHHDAGVSGVSGSPPGPGAACADDAEVGEL